MLVAASHEHRLIHTVLSSLGTSDAAAAAQADHLVEADLRGHSSHGLQRLAVIVSRIEAGLANANAEPRTTWPVAGTGRIDGDRGLGPFVGMVAMHSAIARARETGIALVAVHNNNHLGILAPYVERAVQAGMIGIVMTTSEALVHPWGGTRALIGTNPIAIGIPAEPAPFVFDMATGVISMGKVQDHAHRGIPLEPGWALDADGRPTTDPVAARSGAIAPFGGAKGYGLGLAIELLVAGLTGSELGDRVRGTLDASAAANKGDVFIAIAPGPFGHHDMEQRLGTFLDEIRSGAGAQVPGDRARSGRATRLREGVEIADAVWATAMQLHAEHVGGPLQEVAFG
jgi:L-2-hydroxycarboxylate dehydrogenase (NAD+)